MAEKLSVALRSIPARRALAKAGSSFLGFLYGCETLAFLIGKIAFKTVTWKQSSTGDSFPYRIEALKRGARVVQISRSDWRLMGVLTTVANGNNAGRDCSSQARCWDVPAASPVRLD
ncbi:MAG: hypothetical protein GYB24_09070 [Rhodobacteraceae bacterium]|nr:hypothetical protein [Paracoccaceae bacterium]